MAEKRGVSIVHTTIMHRALKFSEKLDKVARKLQKSTVSRYFLDQTSTKAKGGWKYLYGAVDEAGQTFDYLLSAKLDKMQQRNSLERQSEQILSLVSLSS